MKQNTPAAIETGLTHWQEGREEGKLDLVIPFTTPALTVAALNAANRLGAGLHARIRLLKIQIVPYPLDLGRPPVALDCLKEQLRRFSSALPVKREIRLARELERCLRDALNHSSLVVLATPKRPWRTRTERLAAHLRRGGYSVVLVPRTASPDLNTDREGAASPRTTHA
jgi:hypothetical protein